MNPKLVKSFSSLSFYKETLSVKPKCEWEFGVRTKIVIIDLPYLGNFVLSKVCFLSEISFKSKKKNFEKLDLNLPNLLSKMGISNLTVFSWVNRSKGR